MRKWTEKRQFSSFCSSLPFCVQFKNLLGRMGPENWLQKTHFLESIIRQLFWGVLFPEEDWSPTLCINYLHIKCLSPLSHLFVWELLSYSQQTKTQYWKLTSYRFIFKLRTKAKARNTFVQRWYQFTLPLLGAFILYLNPEWWKTRFWGKKTSFLMQKLSSLLLDGCRNYLN